MIGIKWRTTDGRDNWPTDRSFNYRTGLFMDNYLTWMRLDQTRRRIALTISDASRSENLTHTIYSFIQLYTTTDFLLSKIPFAIVTQED